MVRAALVFSPPWRPAVRSGSTLPAIADSATVGSVPVSLPFPGCPGAFELDAPDPLCLFPLLRGKVLSELPGFLLVHPCLLAFVLLFGYPYFMAKSIPGTQKKRGRPKTTGRGTQIGMRWHQPLLGMIDSWAAQQDDKPDRPDAIRRLVERALANEPARDVSPTPRPAKRPRGK
jgi:hypothetical protein